jgi:hypothetical protein
VAAQAASDRPLLLLIEPSHGREVLLMDENAAASKLQSVKRGKDARDQVRAQREAAAAAAQAAAEAASARAEAAEARREATQRAEEQVR